MQRCHAGVHVLLKKFVPKGICTYVHCSAHRLSLVINDTCKIVAYMLDYFSIIPNLHFFFTDSGVSS